MNDLPDGPWSPLLIGHQWPGSESLAGLAASAENRTATAAAHHSYAETLRSIRIGVVAEQQGIVAEAARHAFRTGEDYARNIAESNETKRDSYREAHRHVTELRSALRDIADSGNAEIRRALDSHGPLPEKVSTIVRTITDAQTQANAKAAECSANLFGAIETTLGTGPSGQSAREFSSANGVDLLSAFRSPNPEALQRQVEGVLEQSAPGALPGTRPAAPESVMTPTIPSPTATGSVPSPESAGAAEPATGPESARTPVRMDPGAFIAGRDLTGSLAELPGRHVADGNAANSNGVSGNGVDGNGAGQTDQVRTPAVTPSPAPAPATAGPPTVAAPFAAAAAAASRPPTSKAAGAPPLAPAAYGSDLRTPATTAPSPSAIPPAPAAPASAPVGGAGAPATSGQPVAVRRDSGAVAGQDRRHTTNAGPHALATAGSPGADAPQPAAEQRLHRLLALVTRQQPRLRWGIGDLEDGRTVVVTDLACGWIPPGITIPAEVRLPQPPGTTGGMAALLNAAARTVVYEPGQGPGPEDHEPVKMADHAYRGTTVADLGWKLTQATKWRAGLPRLAHTMARAGTARSGYLDSEIALLRSYLEAVSRSVLSRYPDEVDRLDIGNWQLLASTEALILDDTDRAGYHLAWFLAQTATAEMEDT